MYESHQYVEHIEDNGDTTLRNIVEIIERKNNIRFGCYDDYYFIEYKEPNNEYFDEDEDEFEHLEIDSEINMDTQLKYLTVFEVEVNINY